MSYGGSSFGSRPFGDPQVASGATDTAVNPGVGTLTITGYAPTVAQTANQAVSPGAGTLTLTGYAPTVAQTANQAVTPDVGALTITGYAPTVTQTANQAIAPGVGSLTITGYAPSVTQTHTSAETFSGGFFDLPQRKRTKADIKAERQKYGIIAPDVAEAVIVAVDAVIEEREVSNPKVDQRKAEKEFRKFLDEQKKQWVKEYSDLIKLEYERREQENEDEQVVLLLLNF